MKASEIVEQLKPALEQLVIKAVEANSDKVVELVLKELAKLIPSNIDDKIIEQFEPQIKAAVKAFLIDQAEKIS